MMQICLGVLPVPTGFVTGINHSSNAAERPALTTARSPDVSPGNNVCILQQQFPSGLGFGGA